MEKRNRNPIISLNPKFFKEPYPGRGGESSTFRKCDVLSTEVIKLKRQLSEIRDFFLNQKIIDKALVSIRYKAIVAKSRRVKSLFCCGKVDPYSLVVGSRYEFDDKNKMHHLITYYVSFECINHTIQMLNDALTILDKHYNSVFKNDYMSKEQKENQNRLFINVTLMKKTPFFQIMSDVSSIVSFECFLNNSAADKDSLVTLFSIFSSNNHLRKFLTSLGISATANIFDSSTVLLKPYELQLLMQKAPFLIAQSVSQLYTSDTDTTTLEETEDFEIEEPTNEPVIGVFDTMFTEKCYFHKWVNFKNLYPEGTLITSRDENHGTKIDFLLVDGPSKNGWLEDNCGRFQVRHFGVALADSVNVELIFNNLERIVAENLDIKVWNFSLGDKHAVDKFYVSSIGALIDEVSRKYNVIFVVCGTNIDSDIKDTRIGAPADSLNALVVNSVDEQGKRADYARNGPVLTLYTKPDVSYYGGTIAKPIIAYSKEFMYESLGTSYATPWICRKLAYLIHYLQLDPLVAKALIIDSAAKWDLHPNIVENQYLGYGVVPKNINDIVVTSKNEIRFVLCDSTLEYNTKITSLPVPISNDGRFHYYIKATMCYLTKGNRNQGVDYSSSELDVKLGRNILKIRKDKTEVVNIDSINKDKQHMPEDGYVTEERACIEYQKWNNTKHLVKASGQPMKSLYGKHWGIAVTHIDRFLPKQYGDSKYGLKFAIVATIKTIKGIDAPYETFFQSCVDLDLRPKIIDIDTNIKLYNEAYADIEWKQ